MTDETETVATQLLAASIEVDLGLAALTRALQRRREFIEELAGLGVETGALAAVDAAVVARLAPVVETLQACSMETADRHRLQAAGALRADDADAAERAALEVARRKGAAV